MEPADIGSVWTRLILLKLKTYCWNHCSKIIFKCVNSTVGPIFNKKVVKKWHLWVHEQYIMYCWRQKSQHLRLLFIEQYMNSNRVLPKRVKKKKKKKKRKTQMWEENVDPNIHLDFTSWSLKTVFYILKFTFVSGLAYIEKNIIHQTPMCHLTTT